VGILPLLGWNTITPALMTAAYAPNSTVHQCLFMEVMNFDYMTFNFLACVLPPLTINCTFYFLIFWSVRKEGALKRGTTTCMTSICQKSSVDSYDFTKETTKGSPASVHNREIPHQVESDIEISAHDPSAAATTGGEVSMESTMRKQQREHGVVNVAANLQATLEGEAVTTTALDQVEASTTSSSNHNHSTVHSNNNVMNNSAAAASPKRVNTIKRNKMRRKDQKIAAVLAFIVITFAICWLPLHIMNMLFRFEIVDVPPLLIDAAVVLSHANSAFNFFLYSWRLQSFKLHLKKRLPFLSFCY